MEDRIIRQKGPPISSKATVDEKYSVFPIYTRQINGNIKVITKH